MDQELQLDKRLRGPAIAFTSFAPVPSNSAPRTARAWSEPLFQDGSLLARGIVFERPGATAERCMPRT